MRAHAARGFAVRGAAAVIATALACFSLRRLVLLVASLLPPRRPPPAGPELPSMVLVVAARDEAPVVDSLLAAIDSLDYSAERLFTVLVDDCSADLTGARLAEWAAARPRALSIQLSQPLGKHGALRQGMAAADGELIAFCDADVRPSPDCLRRLAEAFSDETVAAATAFLSPENGTASPVARYAAVESWVTQLVTFAGKDRLDLNAPTPGGCCAYRREALAETDWLGPNPGADVRATVALTRAGWRTRFVPEAVAQNTVVQRWDDYWHQHIRWARNLFAARGGTPSAANSAPLRRRVEAWVLSFGYADRLLLLGALLLMVAGRLRPRFAGLYLTVATAEVGAALAKARVGGESHRFLLWTPVLFVVDVAASLAAAVAHLLRLPRGWRQSRRPGRKREIPE